MSGPYGRDEKEPGEDIDHPIIEHKTPGVLASELREEEDEDEPSFTEVRIHLSLQSTYILSFFANVSCVSFAFR